MSESSPTSDATDQGVVTLTSEEENVLVNIIT